MTNSKFSCAPLFKKDKKEYRRQYLIEKSIRCDACKCLVNRYNIKSHQNTYKHKFNNLKSNV